MKIKQLVLRVVFFCLCGLFLNNCKNPSALTDPVGPGPFNIQVNALSEDAMDVSWSEPADFSGGTIIFEVYLNDTLLEGDFSGTSFNYTGLDADTLYRIRIRAINNEGEMNEVEYDQHTLPAGYGHINNFTIMSGGLEREYSVYVPSLNDSGSVPLLFDFHGWSGIAKNEIMSERNYGVYLAQREGFIYVKPQGLPYYVPGDPNSEWNFRLGGEPWDDALFTEDLMDECISSYNIDESRIYMMGMSSGGCMSWFAGVILADRVAAIAVIAGALYPEVFDAYPLDRPFPAVIIHGTSDTLVPYNAALDVIGRLRQKNHCNHQSITNLPDLDPNDYSTVTLIKYWGAHNDSMIYFYRVNGGYHGVPGLEEGFNNDINSFEVIWDFLREYTLP